MRESPSNKIDYSAVGEFGQRIKITVFYGVNEFDSFAN
jgi:hypothetical protein